MYIAIVKYNKESYGYITFRNLFDWPTIKSVTSPQQKDTMGSVIDSV